MKEVIFWVALVLTLLVVGVGFGGIVYQIAQIEYTQGKVITSTTYPAGTIKDGETYTVVGYNITASYRGLTTTTTVLCPLYPVGAQIPVEYLPGWWGLGHSLSIGSLPSGCESANYGF